MPQTKTETRTLPAKKLTDSCVGGRGRAARDSAAGNGGSRSFVGGGALGGAERSTDGSGSGGAASVWHAHAHTDAEYRKLQGRQPAEERTRRVANVTSFCAIFDFFVVNNRYLNYYYSFKMNDYVGVMKFYRID